MMKPKLQKSRLAACGRAVGLGLGLALVLAGCSTGAILADKLPESAGGLPADSPARPQAATFQYPAVHDMPPDRPTEPMTDKEQVQLERDLESARDRLESKAEQVDGSADAKKPAKKPVKPKSPDGKSVDASGAAAKP